ncbi:MAG: rRNA maturation RNase YbeY [Patescibacteria group bacterium]
MLDLIFNTLTTNRTYKKVFFEKILKVAATKTGLTKNKIELSVNLVGEGKIKNLNKKYRAKHTTTDVLSFPLQDNVSTKSKQGGIISLGDIFICLSVAKRYASKNKNSLDRELTFLTVHGFLHLLGYDHEKSVKEEIKMASLQNIILNKLGF